MYKVSQKHLREAVHSLLHLIEANKKINLGDGDVLEVYPMVVAYRRDEDSRIYVEGPGVSLLAFLTQKTQAAQPDRTQCEGCSTRYLCKTSSVQGLKHEGYLTSYGSNIRENTVQREAVADILEYMRGRYPEVYIPHYTTAFGLSWIDVVLDLKHSGDFWLSAGLVGSEHDCEQFEAKKDDDDE